MRRWPLLALLALPVVDVLLLVFVAGLIGVVETVLLVVLTALVGLLLVRAEGRHALAKIQRRLAAGETPTAELLDAGLLLVAGVLLLTPGLVTDALGLVLALPPTRYPVRVALSRWLLPLADDYTGGFVSGDVYTFQFPGASGVGDVGDAAGPWGEPPEDGSRGRSDVDGSVDLGPDAYQVDVEDGDPDDGGSERGDGRGNGNA